MFESAIQIKMAPRVASWVERHVVHFCHAEKHGGVPAGYNETHGKISIPGLNIAKNVEIVSRLEAERLVKCR